MALNIVFIAFFVIAFIIALIKFFVDGDTTIFKTLVDGIFDSAKSSVVDVAFSLIGTMVFFLGLMNIAEKAGAINWLARKLNPLMKRLFPEVPDGHPVMGEMVMNFSANILGLDNAATPFGLKSMQSLENINPHKGTASNAQIMFLVLHTSGLTLIPLSIFTYRISVGSTDATSVFIPCVLGTLITTLASIIVVGIRQKLKWDAVLLAWIIGLIALVCVLMIGVNHMSAATKTTFSTISGNLILLIIIVAIIVGGAYKKVSVFDAFIEGAIGGFEVAVKIIPYLVGMLVAISLLRTSGTFDYLIDGMKSLFAALGTDTRFVDGLPTALIKPLSGGGARGMMIDTMKAHGADSFAGRLACVLQGSSDTTFYVIAVYFGAVNINDTRYSVGAMLLADLVGILTSIFLAYMFFGASK